MSTTEPYGKYGLMRLKYIKQHKPVFYSSLLTKGSLQQHLNEIDNQATSDVESLLQVLIKTNPLPDKQENPEQWVQCMNNLKQRAEEVVCERLIYV